VHVKMDFLSTPPANLTGSAFTPWPHCPCHQPGLGSGICAVSCSQLLMLRPYHTPKWSQVM
jgi:hypothetical protein